MEDLKDRAFQTHNEITIRDGRKLIAIGYNLLDVNGFVISAQKDYNSDLITDGKGVEEFDIMKVYNPINKETVFDRKDFVDWSKVAVDTKILVSDDNINWCKRYFRKYEDGKVLAFCNGATSWSNDRNVESDWKYARLADE